MSLGGGALARAQAELAAGVRETPFGSHRGQSIDNYAPKCVRHGQWIDVIGLDWCSRFACEMIWREWAEMQCLNGGYGLQPLSWVSTPCAPPWPPVNLRAAVSELVVDAKSTSAWTDVRDFSVEHSPMAGDLLIFGRNGKDPRAGGLGHVAIVESITFAGSAWVVISGNGPGGAVARETRTLQDRSEPVVGFIRVD